MLLGRTSTVAQLRLYDCQIQSSQLVYQVNESFKNNPSLPGIILFENNQMRGMISQKTFLQYMNRPYTQELYFKRSIKYLLDELALESLIVSKNTSILDAVQRSLARPPELLEEPILVQFSPSDYKILNVHDLLIASLQIQKQINQFLILTNQELQDNLRTDLITGLGNHRLFEEYLRREWKRTIRDRSWISLIKFEIDFFEEYKQFYGEISANNCLHELTKILKELAKRPADLPIYSQKGQFSLLLPETNLLGAVYLADILFDRIQDLQIINSHSNVDRYLTISLGITCIKPTQLNRDDGLNLFIDSATNALKRAIENGRNCKIIESFSNFSSPEIPLN